MNSTDLKKRAQELSSKTESNSVTPKEVGGLMFDLATFIDYVQRNGANLGVRQVYSSIEEMEADTTPIDLWGNPIRKGHLVFIYDGTESGQDNNKIYAYLDPGWKYVSTLGTYEFTDYNNLLAKIEDTDSKVSQLGSEVYSEVYSNACGKNLFNKSNITEGFFIGQNGKETPNAEYFYADIPVKPNTTYYINKSGVGGGYVIYNESKMKVSSGELKVGTITIPGNGFYIRISTRLSNLDTLQVEVGDKGTNYEVFYQSNSWYDWYKYASVIVGGDINNDSLLAINNDSYLEGFLEGNGKVVSNAGFSVTDYIEIPTNTLFIDVVGIFTNPYGGGVGFYDESKTFISSIFMVGITQDTNERYVINTIDIPQNARYIRSCAAKKGDYSTVVATVDSYNVVYKILKGHEELKKALNKNSDDINSLINFKGKNLFDKSNITEGYFFDFSGTIISNADYFYSDYIPVKPNTTYYINKSGVGGGYVIYNESKMKVSSGELKVGTITIPGNGFYIRISTRLSNLDTLQFEVGTEGTSYEEYYAGDIREIIKQNEQDVANVGAYTFPRLYKKESFVEYLSEGDFVEIPNTPNVKNKHSISFHANVGIMGKLRMSHGTGAYIAGIFEVDGTNIYVYSNSSPSTIISTIPHGLNISEYIHIQFRISDTFHSGNITLTTANGQSFKTEIEWNGCSLNATVNCLSGSYSKAKLIFGGNAWKEKVWIFGDSYTDYWPRYMEELRASKFLLDGYSGRGSAAAYTSFVNELEYGMPGVVLWMMGMNDADTSDAISSYYKTNFDKMKMYCESKGIIFVPCTIPNVPERIHTFKNQYIKDNSQYYIDMAKVLGAEEMYSSWNTGLLSSDKVHPTNDGAKLIALTLCEEMPSMLND